MTFFGEVVYPQGDLSDDEDFNGSNEEEINGRNRYEIKFSDEFSGKFSKKGANRLIIAVNYAPCAFLRSYLIPVGNKEQKLLDVYLNPGGREDDSIYARDKKPCYSLNYSEKLDSLLITCSKEVDDEICYEIVAQIYDLCKFKNVCVLNYKSSALDYIGRINGGEKNLIDDEYKPFLRQMRTSYETAANSLRNVKLLEAPNVLNGLTAAVLSFCEIRNLPATALIAYGRSALFSSDDVQLFKCLADLPNFGNLVQKNEQEAVEIMRSLLDNQSSVFI